jgi:hypothetical protein
LRRIHDRALDKDVAQAGVHDEELTQGLEQLLKILLPQQLNGLGQMCIGIQIQFADVSRPGRDSQPPLRTPLISRCRN